MFDPLAKTVEYRLRGRNLVYSIRRTENRGQTESWGRETWGQTGHAPSPNSQKPVNVPSVLNHHPHEQAGAETGFCCSNQLETASDVEVLCMRVPDYVQGARSLGSCDFG